ncbi:MAG: hypothetical protein IJR85_07605 [Synergistaceae bacterium]|nr:hypothetical protein [Synergistaceae bacterium]
MKKVLAVVAVVCVVFAAGAALAQPKGRDNSRRLPMNQGQGVQAAQNMPGSNVDQRMGRQFEGRGPAGMPPAPFEGRGPREMCGRRGERRGMMFAPDMPEEIKAKAVEAAKLRIDLDAALSEKPVNKDKAVAIFAQIQKAEQEIDMWKFGKKIERIEEFRKQQELNRNVPPAPKAEAVPEVPAEKAE